MAYGADQQEYLDQVDPTVSTHTVRFEPSESSSSSVIVNPNKMLRNFSPDSVRQGFMSEISVPRALASDPLEYASLTDEELNTTTPQVVLPQTCKIKYRHKGIEDDLEKLELDSPDPLFCEFLCENVAEILDVTCKLEDEAEARSCVTQDNGMDLGEDKIDPLSQILPRRDDPLAAFYSQQKQDFSLVDFIIHIMENTGTSYSVLVTGLAYMFRVQKASEERRKRLKNKREIAILRINSYSVHRILVTCLVIAAKYLEHSVITNKDFAEIAGLSSVEDLNFLELEILSLLNYNLKMNTLYFKYLFFFITRVQGE